MPFCGGTLLYSALEFASEHMTDGFCLVCFCYLLRGRFCARVQESALCGPVSLWQSRLDWSDGPAVESCSGILSAGQMGRDRFASEVVE